ncbi:MAG: flavocytochrome c [Bacillota bacterium]|nr:flavocytochrome c [Bacillota bacterium]
MRKHRSLLALALALTLVLPLFASASSDGTFEGVGKGRNGDIVLQVTIKDKVITDITCTQQSETPGYADSIKKMADAVVAQNTLDVDAVSGVTYTSAGFMEALKDAVSKAGLSENDFAGKAEAQEAERTDAEETHQIVVVGAGGAGMVAAISAKLNGATDVVLLEKQPFVGGNTLISGAEFAAPGNWLQKEEGIEDSADLFYEDVLKAGGNPDLIRVLADNSLEDAIWLRDVVGVEWIDELMFFGGHTVKRSLIPKGNTGTELITKMKAKCEELGVDIRLNTRATELLVNEAGDVVGVKAESPDQNITFHTKAVVIATGGFGNNLEMRKKNDPNVDEKVLSTNARGIDGDGIVMAEKIGAATVGMEWIQLYPICHPKTGALLYVDDTRLFGKTLIVNKEGKRFVEELGTRYEMSMGIKAQTGSVAYELMTVQDAADCGVLKNHLAEVEDLLKTGDMVEGKTLKEVADAMGVDAQQLEKTVEAWNGYVKDGKDLEFNKRGTLYPIGEGPYWLLRCAPAVHHTMGGIVIDTGAHVLRADGTVIKGLYAAGETTGGIHGNNRLGSAAIADITVFGKIAGESAAAEAK